MEAKALRKTAAIAVFWIVLLVVVLSSATFAWFTFTTTTNITPMNGTVNGDGVNLLISNNANGPFGLTCELLPEQQVVKLVPMSTSDLRSFYMASTSNSEGIAVKYKDVSDHASDYMITGSLYLMSEGKACAVSFDPTYMDFGTNIQALASLRFGISFTGADGGTSYIFNLDNLGYDLSGAASRQTAELSGSVYNGSTLVGDPSQDITAYYHGGRTLYVLPADQVVRISYFLYLEGCDDNCYNPVQTADVALQLGFYGDPVE